LTEASMCINMVPMKAVAPSSHARSAGEAIDIIRRFNRRYTRQLGLLDSGLLGSEFTLTEARVLYELANCDDSTATGIAGELGIDLGYLSRLIKKFARRRYIKRKRSPVDARQSRLQLTERGRAVFDPLDRAARHQIAEMLAPMTPEQRSELLSSMQSVQRLLEVGSEESQREQSQREPYIVRPLQVGDIGWITHRQGVLYSREYGWDATYEALVADILAGFVKNFDSNLERGWVAERDGGIIGSVFLVRASADLAKLRLLYVEPTARGSGVGKRLVQECIEFARVTGYETLTLWTNDVLVSARRIYQAAGFQLTKEERHHSFGKDLVGQTWDLAL
jgi:DNA-binding MarR family transcriptional regulator/GNAT superfamily N-acetyltransferase